MSKPEEDEVLFAYITVASYAVSLILVRDKNGVRKPIYYVSKSLQRQRFATDRWKGLSWQ